MLEMKGHFIPNLQFISKSILYVGHARWPHTGLRQRVIAAGSQFYFLLMCYVLYLTDKRNKCVLYFARDAEAGVECQWPQPPNKKGLACRGLVTEDTWREPSGSVVEKRLWSRRHN
jgi:hypothetical protein